MFNKFKIIIKIVKPRQSKIQEGKNFNFKQVSTLYHSVTK